ncbi:Methyltransferase domain protein [uncultured archaeon]|nr:Methyltransferase domain protein [uncultured archaeon]
MNPQQVYDLYRKDPLQDMWDYSPMLRDVAKGNILEIGARGGVSTAAFLLGVEANGGHVYSMDINPDCATLYEGHPQWTFIHANSGNVEDMRKAVRQFKFDGWLDILLIDGDHSYDAVCRDIGNWVQWVCKGGLIFMHDVDPQVSAEQIAAWGWVKDEPRRAYDEFVAATGWEASILPGRFGMGRIVKGQLSGIDSHSKSL